MKKVIIIILAVLLAVDIGVLAYGISRGKDNEFNAKVGGLKLKPAESVYANAENYNSFADMIDVTDPAERMANLLVKTTYNLIESTGFYVFYRTDIVASDGQTSCSENFRAVNGSNDVYQTLTSSSKFEKRQIRYYNEELLQSDLNLYYDKSGGYFLNKLNSPGFEEKTFSKKTKEPDALRSWFDFPIYLGDETMVFDAIDGATVEIKEETADYVTWTFSVNETKMNAYEDEFHHLANYSLGAPRSGAKVRHIDSLTAEVTIWKSGLFRDMTIDVAFDGELDGKSGRATVTKNYQFSYAPADASTAYWLRKLDWAKFLTVQSDIDKYNEEIAQFADLFEEGEEE